MLTPEQKELAALTWLVPETIDIDTMTVEKCFSAEGITRYAVRRGRGCLSKKTWQFEYETLPSNRDNEFMQEFRFDTFDQAWGAAVAARDNPESSYARVKREKQKRQSEKAVQAKP